MKKFTMILGQMPRILFAHGYRTDDYAIDFSARPDFWEISYVEQGDIQAEYEDGETDYVPASSIHIADTTRASRMHSDAPLHSHFTVGFRTGGGEGDMAVVLPRILPIDQHNSHIERTLKELVRTYAQPGPLRDVTCAHLLMELLEQLARAAQETGGIPASPGGEVYARRAMAYIARNLHRSIRVEEIASDADISPGHLSRLFRETAGCTLVDYINRAKIDRVKELILAKDLTLREAGEQVGIPDENYLSRLFHRYAGMTVREFRMLRITL